MADSCSNLNRSRTELLASMSKPTCSGRLVSAWKLRISCGGLLSSTMLKVALLQIGDAAAVLVGDREHDIDFVRVRAMVVRASSAWAGASAGF